MIREEWLKTEKGMASIKKARKKFYEKNKEEILKKANANPRKTYANSIYRLYRITIEDYDEMYIAQNGKCAVCGSENIIDGKRKMLCVDHNHETGKVRGLLCRDCNLAAGLLEDDSERASKLSEYLSH